MDGVFKNPLYWLYINTGDFYLAYFLCSALRYLPTQCFIEFSDMYAVHKTMIQLQRHLQSFYAVLIPVLSPCYARNCIVRVKIPFICKSSQLHPGKACKINQISCQSYTLPRLSSYREMHLSHSLPQYRDIQAHNKIKYLFPLP